MTIDSTVDPVVVRAAGGIVWWLDGRVRRLAVIHRPKYRDWSLPKGKLEVDESWQQAALREVLEETGCEASLGDFAGQICYLVKGHPKVVLYWNMERVGECSFTPSREVDCVEWLSRSEALKRLAHPAERRLLNENRHR
jgi:8-oxo-dGTP pyrophosphatase MutT (NUDIX family)